MNSTKATQQFSVLCLKASGSKVVFKAGVDAAEADELVRQLRKIGCAARRATMDPADRPGVARRSQVEA